MTSTTDRRVGGDGPNVGQMVRVETAKLRHLRIPLLGLLMTGAPVLFASTNLFSSSGRAAMHDPNGHFWASHLIGYVMATCLFTPVFVAVLASRVVDVEHAGNGWGLYAVASVGRGRQCRVKWLTLVPLVVLLRAIEMGGAVAVPLLLGAQPMQDPAAWALLGVQATGTTLALLALHVWLAARIDSQLVGVGLGIAGGLLAMLSLLAPPWLASLTPWGYFALLLPYTFTESGVASITPDHLLWSVFIALMTTAFWFLTGRLDAEKN